ncbi:MAG TPA: hypothetical protein VLA33_05950 [Gemmatimonadota bacterium]|nr:hypothetical protein [Gemmatimonadota bacterium]
MLNLQIRARSGGATMHLITGVSTALVAGSVLAGAAVAQEADEHDHAPSGHHEAGESGHHAGLHFAHPLIAESVSPDTKMRLDYGYQDLGAENGSELELEGEYAFHRSVALEVGTHFDASAGELGETHVILKFANFAFEEHGLLLGYGLELGLPTGASHAHGGIEEPDHEHAEGEGHQENAEEQDDDVYEFAPFLNAGLAAGPWELIAWTRYAIPTNQGEPAEVGPELLFDLSVLLHATEHIEPVLEMSGTVGLGGPQADRETLTLSPGVRVRPVADQPLVLGGALSLPLTNARTFDTRVLVSAFWHF